MRGFDKPRKHGKKRPKERYANLCEKSLSKVGKFDKENKNAVRQAEGARQ